MSESTTRSGMVYKTMSKKESQGEGTAVEPRTVEKLLRILVEDQWLGLRKKDEDESES